MNEVMYRFISLMALTFFVGSMFALRPSLITVLFIGVLLMAFALMEFIERPDR